ncbi:MAG TPA: M67 family metallopeptidase [Vicinamibacterales bacterium]
MSGRTAVAFPPDALQAIARHARRAHPRECCGFLVGARRRVLFAVATQNIARGRSRYRIDDATHIALRRTLRRFAPPLEIVGVYHSHPNGEARPSATDVAEAFYPAWTYLIVGMRPRVSLRAFRIVGGRTEIVAIRTESGDRIYRAARAGPPRAGAGGGEGLRVA